MSDECQETKARRNTAVARAASYGYTLREIAGHLGPHYSTVSLIIKTAQE